MMFMSINSNTTGVTSGSGIANPSEAPEFTPGFSGVRAALSLVFCVLLCRLLFVLYLLAIVLSVLYLLAIVLSVLYRLAIVLSVLLRVTDSDYPFGIFKLFIQNL